MDSNDMKKTSTEPKLTCHIMVSKLHNMQWLRNMSHPSYSRKTKAVCKKKQNYNSDNKEDDFSTKDSKRELIEGPDKSHLTIDSLIKHSSNNTTLENNETIWDKDVDALNMFQLVYGLSCSDSRSFEEKELLSMAESIITAKLEAQCYINEERKHQANLSQNNIEDHTQKIDACPNISNLQEVDWNKKGLELVKHADGDNNNYSKPFIPVVSHALDVQKTILEMADEKSIEVSEVTQRKGKGVCTADRFNNKPVLMGNLEKDIQWTEHVNQPENNQLIRNNILSDHYLATRENTIIASQQQSSQNIHLQQTILQAENQLKQMQGVGYKFHDQHLPINDSTRLSRIPNTFNSAPYKCNVQIPSDSNIMPTFMSPLKTAMHKTWNKEYSDIQYRHTPNIQQKPVTMFSGPPKHLTSYQINNLPKKVEQFGDTTSPESICIYNPETFGPDLDNAHATNYLLSPPVFYTPSPYMQSWNPQLQYSMPNVRNSPRMTYTTFPNITNQSDGSNDVNASPIPMHVNDQQHKYIHSIQTNNNFMNTRLMQMHTNTDYTKDPYNREFSNCAVEAVDNVLIKPNRYYKNYQNTYQAFDDVPECTTSISYVKSQQPSVPADIDQCNLYRPLNQKRYTINYMQISKSAKDNSVQDLCEDKEVESISPIISPKEFVTNNTSLSNKTDKFATRVFKLNLKPPLQSYAGVHRNTACKDISKKYKSSISVGRGISKIKRT